MELIIVLILGLLGPYIAFFGVVGLTFVGLAYSTIHPIESWDTANNLFLYGIVQDIQLDEGTTFEIRNAVIKILSTFDKTIIVLSLLSLFIRWSIFGFARFKDKPTNLPENCQSTLISILNLLGLAIINIILLGLCHFLPAELVPQLLVLFFFLH